MRTKFLRSATDPSQFPPASVAEIGFVGRSNVGKSSLINALLSSHVAHTSSTPGRTRAINFFAVTKRPAQTAPDLLIADLPGYGYAKIARSISAEWPKFIEPYLQNRESLALVVCLTDPNVPPQPSDAQLLRWLEHHQRSYLVVATKSDRLSGNQLANALRRLRSELDVDEILPCSAKTKTGIMALWKSIRQAADRFSSAI